MSDEVYSNETPFLKLDAKVAFEGLSDKEKKYAHYLSRACWYGSLIVLFQTSRESPLIYILLDRLFRSQDLASLKALAMEQAGFSEDDFKALLVYTAAFFSNMGNYRGFGDNKFIPGVPLEKLEKLVKLSKAWQSDQAAMEHLWSEVSEPLYSMKDSEKNLGFPPKGTTTYFSKNCTEKDADLVTKYLKKKGIEGYITRLFKEKVTGAAGDQDCYEIRHASVLSTEDKEAAQHLGNDAMDNKSCVKFTRGDYSPLLKLTVDNLTLAQENAANENQRQMLGKYIESFRVGSLDAHKDGSRFWIHDKGPNVESYIGFIETYRDPAGIRGEFEGFVAMVNRPQSEKFSALVASAEKLLKLLPWPSSFEKDVFLRPDFTSLDVLTFGGSGIPAGINIPNYDVIRQYEGFKNVSLGNVINADDKSSKANFMTEEDNELFNRLKNASFEVQVGLHELLGHGSGKLFVQNKDGSLNFPSDLRLPHKLSEANAHGSKVTSWYKEGESYDSVFGALGSSYEECRAECVGLYLCNDADVLRLFGFEGDAGQDVAYVNWLCMVVKGVEGMQAYNPQTKAWLQAHSRARFVIMRVLVEAGGDLVRIQETLGEDGKPDLIVTVDRSKIASVGRPAIEHFLLQLQVLKSTANVHAAKELYEKYSEVTDHCQYPFRTYWDIVMDRKKPRRIFVQSNTSLSGDSVQLKEYEATPEGHLESWLDRFDASATKELEKVLLELWKKDKDRF